jgi:hypothetical protein
VFDSETVHVTNAYSTQKMPTKKNKNIKLLMTRTFCGPKMALGLLIRFAIGRKIYTLVKVIAAQNPINFISHAS